MFISGKTSTNSLLHSETRMLEEYFPEDPGRPGIFEIFYRLTPLTFGAYYSRA